MIKRTVFLILSLALLVNGVQPIHAADLVAIPQNVHLPTPPSYIQTRSSELSFKSIETKISNVLKPEKAQPKVAASDDSGSCGANVTYTFTAADGKLTISGSGRMTIFSSYSRVPWHYYRSSIKTVVIENGVVETGQYTFSDCTGLTSVSIPDSVHTIGYEAFSGCKGLTSVSIPDSVTVISNRAFYGCTGLTSVSIPDSVTAIGDWAFYCCGGLGSITIPDSVTSIREYAFACCGGLTSVTIGNGVTSIGLHAFSYCTGLTSVTIPDSVTEIGRAAFLRCYDLTSVTIPDSVTSIDYKAFGDCTSLAIVTYEGTSNPNHGENIFSNTKVTHVNVPCEYTSSTFCGQAIERQPCTTLQAIHLERPYSFLRHLLNLFLLGKE